MVCVTQGRFFRTSRLQLNHTLNNDTLFIRGWIALQSRGALFSHICLVCSFPYFEGESDTHLFVCVWGGVPIICKRICTKMWSDRL